MYVCLPLFLFYCFGFLYPKINKLFGGVCVWLHLVIVISSHTHILVLFLFSGFFMVESLARLVSVSWGLFLLHAFISFITFIPFRISSNFALNFVHYFFLNSWILTFIVINHFSLIFIIFCLYIITFHPKYPKWPHRCSRASLKWRRLARRREILEVARLRGKCGHKLPYKQNHLQSQFLRFGHLRLINLVMMWPRNRVGASSGKWKCSGGFWGGNSFSGACRLNRCPQASTCYRA